MKQRDDLIWRVFTLFASVLGDKDDWRSPIAALLEAI